MRSGLSLHWQERSRNADTLLTLWSVMPPVITAMRFLHRYMSTALDQDFPYLSFPVWLRSCVTAVRLS